MGKNIKSETVYRVNHLPGEEIDQDQEFDIKQSYREFDETGNLILEMGFTLYGELSDKIEYRYNNAGKLVESLIYGEDEEILERRETERDQDGRIVREFIHYLDGSTDTRDFEYDEKGNPTGLFVKDDEGETELSEKYYYEDDRLVRIERFDADNKVVFRQEDTYVNGVISGHKIWSSEEDEPFTLVHQFNAAGRRKQELRYNNRNQLVERNIYEEDEKGRVVRIIEENRQRKNTTEFTFDDQGNVTYQFETDLNGNLNHEIIRIYDPDGELIRATVETVVKSTDSVLAYSLIYKHETYGD